MGRYNIPDRWLDYKPIGKIIEGTRFIAFKVPLRQHISESVDDIKVRLDTKTLLQDIPNLGLIIDLTNTYKYYDPLESFEKYGIKHVKIMVPGRDLPDLKYRMLFAKAVEEFLDVNQDNDKLIGVHCTHGVNRTGFLICNYMVREMNIEPKDALERFSEARGHSIERINYVEFINANANKSEVIAEETSTEEYISKRQDNSVSLTVNNESWERNRRNSRTVENWRIREPPPPGTEPLNITDYPRNPRYKFDSKKRRQSPSASSSLVSREANTWWRTPCTNSGLDSRDIHRNSNYLSRHSNERSNDIFHNKRSNYRSDQERLKWRNDDNARELRDGYTARRDNYSREGHSSKSYEQSTTRFQANPRSDYRTENSRYNLEKDSRSSDYHNFDERRDNKSQFNSRKRTAIQRSSMLDDLY